MASCYRCGRPGHRANNCEQKGRPICRRCGQHGHVREHCPTWAPCQYCEPAKPATLARYDGQHCPDCGMPRPDDPCRLHEHTTADQAAINEHGMAKIAAAQARDFGALDRLAATRSH